MEDRFAGDYKIEQSIQIGKKEIVFGIHRDSAVKDLYLCAYYESDDILGNYYDCMVSDDYTEIIALFADRIKSAAVEHMAVLNGGDFSSEDKKPIDERSASIRLISDKDDLNNQIVVLRPDIMRPEYRHGIFQLKLCTGGFGASPMARGRSCFCTNLLDGETAIYKRQDILGIIPANQLPEWAKKSLEKITEDKKEHTIQKKDSKTKKGDAR